MLNLTTCKMQLFETCEVDREALDNIDPMDVLRIVCSLLTNDQKNTLVTIQLPDRYQQSVFTVLEAIEAIKL